MSHAQRVANFLGELRRLIPNRTPTLGLCPERAGYFTLRFGDGGLAGERLDIPFADLDGDPIVEARGIAEHRAKWHAQRPCTATFRGEPCVLLGKHAHCRSESGKEWTDADLFRDEGNDR